MSGAAGGAAASTPGAASGTTSTFGNFGSFGGFNMPSTFGKGATGSSGTAFGAKADDSLVKDDTVLVSLLDTDAEPTVDQFKALFDQWEIYEKQKDETIAQSTDDEIIKSLTHLKETVDHTIKYTLDTLFCEVDHGNEEIREYQSATDNASNTRETQSSTNMTRLQFLTESVERLEHKKDVINRDLENFRKKIDNDDGEHGLQTLVDALTSEKNAIIRCGYRLSVLKENTIRDATEKLKSKGTREHIDGDADRKESAADEMRKKYQKHEKDRKNQLEKRPTGDDAKKFDAKNNQPAATTGMGAFGGGGFGAMGGGFGNFGGFGKTTGTPAAGGAAPAAGGAAPAAGGAAPAAGGATASPFQFGQQKPN